MPEQLTFLLEELPARGSASRESREASVTTEAASRWPIYDFLTKLGHDGSSGRMFQASYPRTGGVTLRSSSARLMGSGIMSRGECWTLSTSEWTASPEPSHRDDGVCSLSDILETGGIPRTYYLSRKVCLGILRRADARGVDLPRPLRLVLERQAGIQPTGTEDRYPERSQLEVQTTQDQKEVTARL